LTSPRRRFRFLQEIAEGGFGRVYLAEQISPDGFSRIVAVKLLHAKWSQHDEVVMRTRDEARLLGLIRHQNIVKVEDLTSIDGKCAIVMEYLEGVDLKWLTQFLKERKLTFPRAALLEIGSSVASALDAAWNGVPLQGGESLRVIHRDIKPSNVFVTIAGGVKVLDFGTARANFAEREARTQSIAFGSQGYMAPERTLGEPDTPAADIFSLGVTIYELLALETFGSFPPRPVRFQTKLEEKLAGLPLSGDPAWGDGVRDLVRRMLAWDPKERLNASQVIERAEDLAARAGDDGLRRLSRTLVVEAKAALPPIEQSDPLTGTVVDEDPSAPQRLTTPPSQRRLTAPPPPAVRTLTPAPPRRDDTSHPSQVPPERTTTRAMPRPSSVGLLFVAVAAGFAMLAFGVLVVLVAAGGFVWLR
jgi:serine/threonine protein kinase